MSEFKQSTQDVGKVKSGRGIQVTFEQIGTKKIDKVISTCSCITGKHIPSLKAVVVSLTPDQIPYHLANEGVKELPRTKIVTVVFEDKSTEVLSVKFIIVK